MKAHDAQQTLAAGGIVPLGVRFSEERTSPLRARTYTRDGKRIVRLEPDAVAAGSDAEMAAFGCGTPEVSAPLGHVRFRTLGFPAWALVHGPPKVAAAALGVVEDLREAKQLVAARPGAAKEAFDEIAEGLTRAMPVLLPSFWEEVGRAAAEAGAAALGAQCFERARQAERAHGLARDPEDADAVFVEFALLGALSAKTLSQYAKDLVKAAGGAEAYRRFRAIVVKRGLGGMPPYSGMGKDLAALAKAAKLDAGAEAAGLVAELLEAPGVARAPIEFWTAYRDAIVGLARGNPAVRARLRAIWPDPRGGTDATRAAFRRTGWVELLDDASALADVPDRDLGAWVSTLIKHAGASPRIDALLVELAPRLAATHQPIAVVAARARWGVGLSLDLAERALELGISLVDPGEDESFDEESMTVDPVRVARDQRYGAVLVDAIADMIGESNAERRMAGKAGFAIARRTWLAARLDELDGKPLPQIAGALEQLESKTTAETFLPWPELHARLASIEIADGLATQLRGGLADELAWPAYERALARLSAGGQPVQLGGAFPVLVMWNAQTAIALDHTGVVAEHDLVYQPKRRQLTGVWHLGGEFLVVLRDMEIWSDVAYWSSAPKETFALAEYMGVMSGLLPSQFRLPDGRISLGGRAFRPGDTVLDRGMQWVADASAAMWIRHRITFVPYDPARGERLAGPPPTWLASWPRAGYVLYARQSSLQPAPAGLRSSALGMRDGMLGLRVRHDERAMPATEVERIDGVRWSGALLPSALVDWPGDTAPRPIDAANADDVRFLEGDGPGVLLHAPAGHLLAKLNEHDWAARGWGLVPPAAFWHYLTPRDPAGSAALRTITAETARALLAGTAPPGVTHPVLMQGIAAHVVYAMELGARLAALVAATTPSAVDRGAEGLTGEAAQLRRLTRALEAGRRVEIPEFRLDLRCWLRHPRAMLAIAHSPIGTEEQRRAARDLARALAGTVLADDLSRLRLYAISEIDDSVASAVPYLTLVVEPIDGSVLAIHGSANWALELSNDGVFRGPPGWNVDDVAKLSRGIGTAWTEAFLALPDAPLPFDRALAETLAAGAGLSVPEATLLYAGAPKLHARDKDFLGKAARDRLGLKRDEADVARAALIRTPMPELHEVIDAGVPDAPEAFARFAEGLARAWREANRGRVALPAELVATANRELRIQHETVLRVLPAFAGDLTLLPRFRLRSPDDFERFVDARGPDASVVADLVTILAWLYVARPVGDPVRAGIAPVVDGLRAAIEDPAALWTIEAVEITDGDARHRAGRDAAVGLVHGGDDGALVVIENAATLTAAFRPSRLAAAAKKRAQKLADAMEMFETLARNHAGYDLRLAEYLASPGFAAFAERVRETPVPDGGYEANPLASVPALVARVAKTKKLAQDAAALYLQTLALAEPTRRDVMMWNGWTGKQYDEAAARLVKAKLVIAGKRERFGRSIFLEGAFTKGDRENLPIEQVKLPYYDLVGRHVPTEPAHLLFARAWKDLG